MRAAAAGFLQIRKVWLFEVALLTGFRGNGQQAGCARPAILNFRKPRLADWIDRPGMV
ncbi:MAG: hypothetical protein GYA48_15695 [Chloroflexi bacterium]|nr:hypothetical protein [Chloroflexota bacterium]